MVLRCSLLGHNYGESEVDREREERGSEVVLTVTEFEACERCGKRNIISENTEVTSIAPEPEEGVGRESNQPDNLSPAGSAESSPSTDHGQKPNSSAIEDAEAETDSFEQPEGAEAAVEDDPASTDAEEIDVPRDENDEPIVDDGEILEDERADTDGVADDRRHGEWPDSEDVGPPVGADDDPTAWPEDEGEGVQDRERVEADEPEDPPAPNAGERLDDDAVILGNDSESTDDSTQKAFDYSVDADSDTEHVSGSDPDSPADSGRSEGGVEAATAAQTEPAEPQTGIASAESAPAPGEGGLPDGAPTQFYCPQCDFVAPGDRGSLRTGDICPDCRKGYLGERTA